MYNIVRIFLIALTTILVLLLAYSLNYLLLNDLIVGNPNSYDTENIKTSYIFDLFYTISSDTGYRPEPSNFNFIFTFIIGIGFGFFSGYKLIWQRKIKNAHTPNNV